MREEHSSPDIFLSETAFGKNRQGGRWSGWHCMAWHDTGDNFQQTDEGKLVPPLKEAPSRLSLMAHRRRNVNGAFLTKIKLRQKCKSNFVGTDPIG